jgi:hypothetical protein
MGAIRAFPTMSQPTHSTFRDKEKDMDTIPLATPGMRSVSRNRTHDKSTGTGRVLKQQRVFRTDVMNAFRAMACGVSGAARLDPHAFFLSRSPPAVGETAWLGSLELRLRLPYSANQRCLVLPPTAACVQRPDEVNEAAVRRRHALYRPSTNSGLAVRLTTTLRSVIATGCRHSCVLPEGVSRPDRLREETNPFRSGFD